MSNIRICTVHCLTIINKTKPPIAYVSLAMWLHHSKKYPTIPTMIFTVGISEKNISPEPTRTFPNQPNTCLPMSKHHQLKRLKMNFYRPGAGVCSVTTHLWAQYATCGSDTCTWNSSLNLPETRWFLFFLWGAGFERLGKWLGNVSKHLLLKYFKKWIVCKVTTDQIPQQV